MAIADTEGLSVAKRALLEKGLRGELLVALTDQSIPRRQPDGAAPASYGQRQLWFLTQLAADSVVYNEAVTVHCPADTDVPSLERAFNEVLRRHEAWRTLLRWRDEDLVQIVTPPREHRLPFVDLSRLPVAERRAEAGRLATEDARRPFDHERGPLWRAKLCHLGDEGCRLHLTLRHLIFDGVSVYRVLLPELIALHDAFRQGRPSPLPEPPIQYGDYASWQRQWAKGEEAARQLGYWRTQLRSLPPLRLPTDRPRPPVQSFRGRFLPIALAADLTQRLRQLGQTQGATLFMTALAGFFGLLHLHTGQEDLAVGTVSSGRRRVELEGLLGYFLNPLVLRGDLSGDPSFRELLSREREMMLAALANDEVPFEHVVREVCPQRDPGANPLFQVVFSLEPPLPDPPAGWDLTQMDVETGTAKLDLYVELDERSEGLIGRLIYNTDLFDVETAERLARDYRAVLEAMVADPDQRLSALRPLTSHPVRAAVSTAPPGTADQGPLVENPQVAISRRFGEMAARFPERDAVRFGEQRLAYAELDRRSNRLARRLRSLGVERESLVGVCLDRSLEMVVALLAILKAGGAYVPLDPSYPQARLALLVEQTSLRLAVTAGPHHDRLPSGMRSISIDEGELMDCADTPPEFEVAPADLAYVLFTSGSTGTPNGVMVEHRSVLRLVCPATYADLGPEEVLLQLAPLAFDASTFEIWGALLNGGRLVVAPPGSLSARELGEVVEREGVTTLWLTAGLFGQVVDAGMPGLGSLRQLITGGEAPSVEHCRRALAVLPETRLVNGYGPTEATTFTCCHRITVEDLDGDRVPIGRPIGNTTVYLLDDRGEPVADGAVGELFVGGAGVARGYLGRPDLTRQRFLTDRFQGSPGRLYRTGDLARRRSDGTIEFIGRQDRQVKVRGYRIELGEVEAALAAHPSIAAAVVEAPTVEGRGRCLVAYVVPRGEAPALSDVGRFLAERLPAHMLPAGYLPLETLPLKPNGKVDREALPSPTAAQMVASRAVSEGTAAGSTVEREVATVWATVLGLETVGGNDDFFSLGGDSLLAVRVIAEVERRFACTLPITAMFGEGSTVTRLAILIERARPVAVPLSHLMVPIRSTGHRPPVFVVEPSTEATVALRHFLPLLDDEQPLIALMIPTDKDGRFDRDRNIQELSEQLLDLVRSTQPSGPYLIAGYSLGGILAYEMAVRLRAAGERIDFFGLIDTVTPAVAMRLGEASMDLRTRLRRLRLSRPARWPGMLIGACRRVMASGRDGLGEATWEFDADGALHLVSKYQVPMSDVPLTVFSSRWQQLWTQDLSLGWRSAHTGPLHVQSVSGDHRTMLLQPNVNFLAACFGRQIRESRQGSVEIVGRRNALPRPAPRVSVVMPARNESANLPYVLTRLPDGLHEVVLVDGHSDDDTVRLARRLRPDIRVVSQAGRGKGEALRLGFQAATGDIVVALDADGSTDPAEIPAYVGALVSGADLAKGSRYLQGGGSADLSAFRSAGNIALTALVRTLYRNRFSDLCYGYTAFWRWMLPMLQLDADGFEIEAQMSVRALQRGLNIAEVPSYEHVRISGTSNLHAVSDGWRVLKTILGERMGRRHCAPLERWLADWRAFDDARGPAES